MIIKGRAVRSIKHWGRYLSEVGENEKAVQHEIRGTVATKLKEALWEMWDIARATKTKGNFLYHASFNLPANESLTPEQWQRAIDLVEKRMGFQGHQRIVYEHVKDGRKHFHVLWNRTDPEKITIRDIKGDRYTLRRVSNQLEREFGLTPTKAVRDYDDPRSYAEWEITGRGRQRLHVEQIKAELTALWKETASARDFIAAVEERGYKFAKGDKRDFVVLDALGDVHSLARRLDGVRVADVRARMRHIDRDSLPMSSRRALLNGSPSSTRSAFTTAKPPIATGSSASNAGRSSMRKRKTNAGAKASATRLSTATLRIANGKSVSAMPRWAMRQKPSKPKSAGRGALWRRPSRTCWPVMRPRKTSRRRSQRNG